MQVELVDVSKTYIDFAIFKQVNLVLETGEKMVVLGSNGSGKSTLLKVISSAMMPSTGVVKYIKNGETINRDKRYIEVSFCAPYIDLIEDLTLSEHIEFQAKFKPFQQNLTTADVEEILFLKRFAHRPIKTYSSGMKQRVRLALAILADAPLLLLDEPTSNLDEEGKNWYKKLLEKWAMHKTIVVGSNHLQDEYFFAPRQINISDYK